MKHLMILLSFVFVSACAAEPQEEAPKACQGGAEYETVRGYWTNQITDQKDDFIYETRLHFDRDEKLEVRFNCINNKGNKATPDEDHVPYQVYDEKRLGTGETRELNPRGLRCKTLTFGGEFNYTLTGSCLMLERNGQKVYFEKKF